VDGKPVAVKTQEKAQVVLTMTEIPVKEGTMQLDLRFDPTVEILPVVTKTRIGDGNKGLKIISIKKEATKLMIKAEGLARSSYELGITNPELIAEVEGATLEEDHLMITFPAGKPGQFISHSIIIHLR
jgi:hypothetical protein